MTTENIVPPLDNVPVGYRFRPTDEELVDFYLKHKLLDDDYPTHIIPDIDLCKVEPWDVPVVILDLSKIKSDDPEWFFFSPLDYKYSNSKRVNRTTKYGFWKATGNDRKIKSRENNHVIGTKKTLVFYEGRVSCSVKSNWVIHEYHATTDQNSQSTFVLCHLKKTVNKRNERETAALICEEAEPSKHMAYSDYENQATTEGIVDVGTLPPMPQSPIGIEQKASFTYSPVDDAYFGNETIDMQIPFETSEDELLNSILASPVNIDDEFLNSILADDNHVSEEREHVFVNSSTQSKSLKRAHWKSSDTYAEVVSALCGNTGDTSTMCNEHPSSGEYHASKMLKSSHGEIRGSIHLLSSNHEANKERKESIIQDNFDFWGMETSCDSTPDKPLEVNIEISSSPSTPRRWKNQYHPRSSNFISHLEAEKELTIVESEKRS